MWSLPMPSVATAMDDLVVAIEGITAAQRARLQTLYNFYDAQLGKPHANLEGPALTEKLKNSIRSAYDLTQKERKLKHIRAALMAAAERCPYCGISAVSDLDHHLAKTTYRPLAIF